MREQSLSTPGIAQICIDPDMKIALFLEKTQYFGEFLNERRLAAAYPEMFGGEVRYP